MIRYRNFLGFSALVLVVLIWSSCGSQRKFFGAENFDAFYQRFHTDSAFQYTRLKFPLQGKRVDADGDHQWTPKSWTPLTKPVFDADTTVFKVEYEQTRNTFTQKSWIDSSGFSVEYRFELLKRKWYLVYAMEVNL
jgi:hypothetical protein